MRTGDSRDTPIFRKPPYLLDVSSMSFAPQAGHSAGGGLGDGAYQFSGPGRWPGGDVHGFQGPG